MRKEISEEQINIESKAGFKPLTIESGITLLPFSELGDREFELLTYLLIQEEIASAEHFGITNISLMQGVAERGRDCVLYNQGVICGLVQCKKFSARLSKPLVMKEIIKFVLFSRIDQSLLPAPEAFEYKLYVSNDLTEPAIKLVNSYSFEIINETEGETVDNYITEVISEYESFAGFKQEPPLDEVKEILRKIKVTYSNATDLSARIYKRDRLLTLFFNVKTIVDLASADSLIRNALDDYGLKYLTDQDLKKLQDRISGTAEGNRINLGFVDFFGYSKEFFRFLKGERFDEVIRTVMKIKYLLDRHLLDFISSKISELILIHITKALLNQGKIHAFSVGVAAPYLLKRLTMTILAGSMPKDMLPKFYPQFALSKQQLVSEVAGVLFDSSERVMAGDYSQLVGSPEDIEFKIRIYAHMHQGLKGIDDAVEVFSKDMRIIQPTLDKIEDEINVLLEKHRTVVIKDSSFFDDQEQMQAFADTIRAIDK
ncbi:hypothetical protein [Stutzerimonas zhaodongensis]|uniref:hypothetical protein n=1 Tax=Stutzerimonas zhaodongensis TaxID=1176257 RepID=UPI001F4DE3AF|nr:hypothetical protein [Stutzerimonas zhaodongensis]UNG19673.1 hypothetical protein MKP10_05370 [Stutzerimonas zhaodongensis]